MITWQALKLSGGDGVSVSASTQSSPTEREKPGEAPQITISIKTTSTRKRKIDGPEDKGSTSASAVPPLRFISGDEGRVDVMGCAGGQVEDMEDPWEMQRLHDAWLAKEFFHAKKQYPLYGPRVCLDCGKRMDYYSMSKHRRFYCKSRPPVARDSIQPRGVRKRAVEIRNQWEKENKECINRSPRSGGKNHRRRAAREAVEQVPCGESLGIN